MQSQIRLFYPEGCADETYLVAERCERIAAHLDGKRLAATTSASCVTAAIPRHCGRGGAHRGPASLLST